MTAPRADALHATILAGGRGERFWPLSRRSRPKQLLPLLDGETLLDATLGRIRGLVAADATLVLGAATIEAALGEVLARHPGIALYAEPASRNTAAAVVYAGVRIARRRPDAVCLVLPSDHAVEPTDVFHDDLRRAARLAADGWLVTFGISPDRAETGYGYVERDAEISAVPDAFAVRRFHEKPDAATAARYLESGRHFWNSGMFAWRADRILEATREALPELGALADALARDWSGEDGGPAARAFYEAAPAVSVDHGVMETARRVAMCRARFRWDDIGAWPALARVRPRDGDGNVVLGTALAQETRDSVLIADGGLVATLGVSGLVVVRTPDVTMVAPAERAQEVRRLVEELRARGLTRYE